MLDAYQFLKAHEQDAYLVLFCISEILALSPLKSNSVFQLVFGFLRKKAPKSAGGES